MRESPRSNFGLNDCAVPSSSRFNPSMVRSLIPVENDSQPVGLAPQDAGTEEYEDMDGVKVYRFRYASRDEDENIAYRGQMHKLATGSIGGVLRF